MKSKLCNSCIHTDICVKDKNLFGDVFITGNPMIFDNRKLYKEYKECEEKGFPCDDYVSIDKVKEQEMEEEKILEALKVIKKVCQTYADCKECPLRNWQPSGSCHLKNIAPVHWCLNELEEPWRAFR